MWCTRCSRNLHSFSTGLETEMAMSWVGQELPHWRRGVRRQQQVAAHQGYTCTLQLFRAWGSALSGRTSWKVRGLQHPIKHQPAPGHDTVVLKPQLRLSMPLALECAFGFALLNLLGCPFTTKAFFFFFFFRRKAGIFGWWLRKAQKCSHTSCHSQWLATGYVGKQLRGTYYRSECLHAACHAKHYLMSLEDYCHDPCFKDRETEPQGVTCTRSHGWLGTDPGLLPAPDPPDHHPFAPITHN